MTTSLPRHSRHRAVDRLRAIHGAVARSTSSIVVVSATDGGGKSHLVDSVLVQLTGITSVLVRALPWEKDARWVVAARVLDRLPRPEADLPRRPEPGSDPPATGQPESVAPGDAPGGAPDGFAVLVDALARALTTAGAGTVIVIDDAEYCDPDSLRVLASALEAAGPTPVLLVLTLGSPARGPSATLCAQLARETVRLGPLDQSEIRELVATRTGREPSAAAARQLLEFTGGEAGAVATVVDEAPDSWWGSPFSVPPLPASVERETVALLADMDPDQRAVLEAAAVLAPPVTLTTLAALITARAGNAPDETVVSAALDAAHEAGLMRMDLSPGAAGILFRSPLLRTSVLRSLAPSLLLELHTLAAGVAEQLHDTDAALDHRASASTGPDPDLSERLRIRALEHARAGHWSDAGRAFLTAAALNPDADAARELHIDGIDALINSGRISEARALSHALERVRKDARRDAVLGSLALHLGHAREAEAQLGRALTAGADTDQHAPAEPSVALALAQKYVVHSLCEWRPDRIRHWAAVVISSPARDRPEIEEARAVELLGSAIDGGTYTGPAIDDRLAGLAPAVAQRFEMATGWIALARDDLETARRHLGSAVPTADVSGSARISLFAQAWLARTLTIRGEWDDALRVVDTAARRVDDLELDLLAPVIHWSGAVVRSMRGDHLGAAAHLRSLTTSSDAYPMQIIPSAMARMQVAAASGDYTSVRLAAEPIVSLSHAMDIDQPGFWPWHDLYAHALVLGGRLDEAEGLIGPSESRAEAQGHRSTLARLGAVRARIAAVRGDVEECNRIFRRSLEHLDGLAMPYYSARMHFGYGQTLRRAGRRREAHLALGTARDIYEQLGARAYVERCDRERRAGGVDVTRTGGNSTLTPQERAVATLVADGRTNAQAAEELFLSVKTVQYHLTRIYSKLGISGRTELAVYVSRNAEPFRPDPPGDQ
ncbi:LuxR family transcriptional regulator [uncultured Dietzia sp.]|uniref:helix-turn-helix transcriptional regulator n=1 Tax=uncultured Dietzia sp. TaxID=395519 RepID=UPI0025CBCE53|nr:LuxR family transcriptional regulator [uncultured Dietzia sp.]